MDCGEQVRDPRPRVLLARNGSGGTGRGVGKRQQAQNKLRRPEEVPRAAQSRSVGAAVAAPPGSQAALRRLNHPRPTGSMPTSSNAPEDSSGVVSALVGGFKSGPLPLTWSTESLPHHSE